ncbi:DUF1353 domain-containing protein [Pseudomonas gingeri]|uniref:DUF1353 domain-containing protein n=1 Tax=Pseudomonas gingeri TaxID=117681 RepID=A0A7Y7XIQ6_9PSED|nr:DUF1353 domain-containing protein [Pseudomonas gingeri]NWA28516.1 DUF1353 domain-containing protein [Pseudomonas gingeri]NWB99552.1 DUF1353 domain-containing protein [Pseudomonas gingeri]
MLLRDLKHVSLLLLTLFIGSCATTNPPNVARLADDVFIVATPLRYAITTTSYTVEVPRGFITDLASIPRSLWWWESKTDRSMAPAIIHDFLYWDQGCSKDEADAVLSLAMDDNGVSPTKRALIYAGVRTPIGEKAYKDNALAKAAGESRYLTSRYTDVLLLRSTVPDDNLESILKRAKSEKGISPLRTNYRKQTQQACKAALRILSST